MTKEDTSPIDDLGEATAKFAKSVAKDVRKYVERVDKAIEDAKKKYSPEAVTFMLKILNGAKENFGGRREANPASKRQTEE